MMAKQSFGKEGDRDRLTEKSPYIGSNPIREHMGNEAL